MQPRLPVHADEPVLDHCRLIIARPPRVMLEQTSVPPRPWDSPLFGKPDQGKLNIRELLAAVGACIVGLILPRQRSMG
ncbi:MAG: hypothetical protein ACKVVP_09055 [Chloroflexota bacterium]